MILRRSGRVSGSIATLFDESPSCMRMRIGAMRGRGAEAVESFEQDSAPGGCICRGRLRIAPLLESPLFHGHSA